MENDTYLYPYSLTEAKRLGELEQWRSSLRANIACKQYIEQAIRESFDGMHLNDACLDSVIEKFGYKRTSYVLANTLKEKNFDGRFSPVNKEWSEKFFVPPDKSHNCDFTVDSHPAVLDGFISQYRKKLDALELFDKQHCVPNSRVEENFENKVLIMDRNVLKEKYWEPKYQLWYARDGFGCSPKSLGRSVRATCLADGETVSWDRSEFLGVIKDEFLPDWARKQIEKIENGQEIEPIDTAPEQTMQM